MHCHVLGCATLPWAKLLCRVRIPKYPSSSPARFSDALGATKRFFSFSCVTRDGAISYPAATLGSVDFLPRLIQKPWYIIQYCSAMKSRECPIPDVSSVFRFSVGTFQVKLRPVDRLFRPRLESFSSHCVSTLCKPPLQPSGFLGLPCAARGFPSLSRCSLLAEHPVDVRHFYSFVHDSVI